MPGGRTRLGVDVSASPRLRVNKVFGAVTAAIISIAVGSSIARAQARSGTIDVAINVPSADSATVEERYLVTSSPIELRVLTRPCATIENLRFERGGVALTFSQSRDGPWITLRDSAATADSFPLIVRYDVRLAGTGAIPLVHLAVPLARSSAMPLGAVSVDVNVSDAASRVEFPHMTRQAPTRWSARYVGVPSFVEVAGGAATECVEPTGDEGDNGGLVWRFFLLVGIMVAWVPLYLAWARRSGESA